MTAATDLIPGAIVWADLSPTHGREQSGHRPAVVVASEGYLLAATTLALVVPITTVDRNWANHVRVHGSLTLESPSWAMTEQVRTISRDRITGPGGLASSSCLAEIRTWLADFLDL